MSRPARPREVLAAIVARRRRALALLESELDAVDSFVRALSVLLDHGIELARLIRRR